MKEYTPENRLSLNNKVKWSNPQAYLEEAGKNTGVNNRDTKVI